jgi:hypothetical protein
MAALKLAILRSERFDIKAAALRMVSFCNAQQQLFGIQSLGRRLQWSKDLTMYEQQILQSGCIQILPSSSTTPTTATSTIGHNYLHRGPMSKVVCYFPKYLPQPPASTTNRNGDGDDDKIVNSIIKVWWYLVQYLALLDDDHIQVQKHGIVGIVYQVCEDVVTLSELVFLRKLWWHLISSLKQLPIRFISNKGFHYCFNDYKIRQAVYLCANYYFKYYVLNEEEDQDGDGQNSFCHFHFGNDCFGM